MISAIQKTVKFPSLGYVHLNEKVAFYYNGTIKLCPAYLVQKLIDDEVITEEHLIN